MRTRTLSLTLAAAAAALSLGAAAPALADTYEQIIDRRQDRQEDRIDQGIRSGELNRREAARLERGPGSRQPDGESRARRRQHHPRRVPAHRARPEHAEPPHLPARSTIGSTGRTGTAGSAPPPVAPASICHP